MSRLALNRRGFLGMSLAAAGSSLGLASVGHAAEVLEGPTFFLQPHPLPFALISMKMLWA